MRSFFYILFLFFATSLFSANYPSLRTVLDELYKRSNVPPSGPSGTVHLAKKPGGWYVQLVDWTKEPVVVLQEWLFWSAKEQQYLQQVQWSPGPTPNAEEEKAEFLGYITGYEYSREPYYGYEGWAKDVIAAFGTKKSLSDTLLEGLGRAYDHYAYSFTGSKDYYSHISVNLPLNARIDSLVKI